MAIGPQVSNYPSIQVPQFWMIPSGLEGQFQGLAQAITVHLAELFFARHLYIYIYIHPQAGGAAQSFIMTPTLWGLLRVCLGFHLFCRVFTTGLIRFYFQTFKAS